MWSWPSWNWLLCSHRLRLASIVVLLSLYLLMMTVAIEALTPGHFLVGIPLEALPDPSASYHSVSLLTHWHLCQVLVRHLWQHWSAEYLNSIQRASKWHDPSRNLCIGDIVILREDNVILAKWPLARVIPTHTGRDNLVCVVTVKTSTKDLWSFYCYPTDLNDSTCDMITLSN